MDSSKEKRLGAGRVAFLARIGVFKIKIDAGHTLKAVYEDHQEDLGISYSQFVNYVNRYIREKTFEKPAKESVSKPKIRDISIAPVDRKPVDKKEII